MKKWVDWFLGQWREMLNRLIGLGDPLILLIWLHEALKLLQPLRIGRCLALSNYERTRHAKHRLAYSGGI